MITENKITEIFCLADDFCKYFSSELKKYQLSDGKVHRNKPWAMCFWVFCPDLTCTPTGPITLPSNTSRDAP